MTEPTTTDHGIDLDALFERSKLNDMMPSSYIRALIVRLRTVETAHQEQVGREIRVRNNVIAELESKLAAAEADLEIRSEQLANVQNRLTKEREEHEEQYWREIRVRNNIIAELEESLRQLELWADVHIEGRKLLIGELNDAKESLRTTRLEQAAKAFEVDELETKVLTLTIGHEKDKQAWMAENTELLTQVQALTAELTDMSHTDYLGRTRLDITNDSLAVRKLNGELRKQVERLTVELEVERAKK